MITVAEVKQALRIDSTFTYSDTQIQSLIDSATAALFATIGYDESVELIDAGVFEKLLKTYVVEYVRGFYFQFDNEKQLNALQTQLQACIKEV